VRACLSCGRLLSLVKYISDNMKTLILVFTTVGFSLQAQVTNEIGYLVNEPLAYDYSSAFWAGFAFGATIFGFGWALRIAHKTADF